MGQGTQAGLLSTQEPKWEGVKGPTCHGGAGAEVMGRDTLTAQASREHALLPPSQPKSAELDR